MKKKGMSAVIATVLIILIVVVGVGIVWKVIIPIFADLKFFGYGDLSLGIVYEGYTIYDGAAGFAMVQIERGPDDVDLRGIEIGFNFGGETVTYQTETVPQPNGRYKYSFNFTADGVEGTPDKVTVAPVFVINGVLELGMILDEKPMPSGRITLSGPGWERVSDGAAITILRIEGPGGWNWGPGKEPVCTIIGAEICGSGVDEDCDGDVDWDDDECSEVSYFVAGDGTDVNPYEINTCFQLQNMSYDLTANYELKKNVDCSMTNTWDGLAGFNPVGNNSNRFTGDFDGKSYEIDGLYINRPTEDYIGLFGYAGGREIRNLGMIDSNITGRGYVGGIAGSSRSSISHSYNTGPVIGLLNYVGGIAGRSYSTISNSYNTGSVSGTHQVGGICGWADLKIANSYNTGNITGFNQIGGITGLTSGRVERSYNTGSIQASDRYAGGIVGRGDGRIFYSFSTGSVSGADSGSIVGFFSSSITVSRWYNTPHNPNKCIGMILPSGSSSGCSPIDSSTNIDYFYSNSSAPMDEWDFLNIWEERDNDFPVLK